MINKDRTKNAHTKTADRKVIRILMEMKSIKI